jgi:hypothetical protein
MDQAGASKLRLAASPRPITGVRASVFRIMSVNLFARPRRLRKISRAEIVHTDAWDPTMTLPPRLLGTTGLSVTPLGLGLAALGRPG